MRHSSELVCVDLLRFGARLARLPIRGGEHDLAFSHFKRPAMRDEARRQIVQQFRMRRLFALRAEVARRCHQRPAEVPAPDAVDDHARGQRRGIGEDSLGQLQPAGSVLEGGVALWPARLGNAAGTISPGVATLPCSKTGKSRASPGL